jgi:hypothetical protein
VLPAQGDENIAKKKRKTDDDVSFQGVTRERKDVNTQSFLQQVCKHSQSSDQPLFINICSPGLRLYTLTA